MTWYRAASIAVLAHLAVLLLFTFTFQGNAAMYRINLVFWGSILRPREVSSQDRPVLPGARDIKDIHVTADPATRLLLWSREISVDKPDLFTNAAFIVNADSFRFVGERVDLDEEDAEGRHPENDIPPPVPVKMRWEQSHDQAGF